MRWLSSLRGVLPGRGLYVLGPHPDYYPSGRIEVDPNLCIGCKLCTSKGPDGTFLEGCPWDAIEMMPTDEWETRTGITPTHSGE